MSLAEPLLRRYRAYGLTIASEFELPELAVVGEGSGEGTDAVDVQICRGKVALPELTMTTIQRQGITAQFGGNRQRAYLWWEGVAGFEACAGRRLTVQPAVDTISPEFLNLYILSEALGLILYQRGFFLLHASAIRVGSQVVVFVGAPGAGKSTTAAAFLQQGYACFGDDMVAMRIVDQQVWVYPAFSQVKIWQTSVTGLGYDASQTPRLFPGSLKHLLRPMELLPLEPLPLAHLFVLEPGERLQLSQMQGHAAFMALVKFFPCPPQVLQGEGLLAHMRQCQQIARCIPIWQMERPNSFKAVQGFVGWLADWMAAP